MTTAFDHIVLPAGKDFEVFKEFWCQMRIVVEEQLKIGRIKAIDKASSGLPVPNDLLWRVFVHRLPVDDLSPSVIFDFLADGSVLSSDENDREFSEWKEDWNWESACSQTLTLFKNVQVFLETQHDLAS